MTKKTKQKPSTMKASIKTSRTTRKKPPNDGISAKAVYYLIRIAMLFSDNLDDFWDNDQI